MLLFPELRSEKYQPDKKQVHGTGHRRVCAYGFPGRLHPLTPVNIIKNQQRTRVDPGQEPMKIGFGRLLPVITVDKCEIKLHYSIQHPAQGIIEISFDQHDIRHVHRFKILPRGFRN